MVRHNEHSMKFLQLTDLLQVLQVTPYLVCNIVQMSKVDSVCAEKTCTMADIRPDKFKKRKKKKKKKRKSSMMVMMNLFF